jgi:N-glycosylase/DNA lyase
MDHRSFNPSSNGHQKFVQQQLKNIQKIQTKLPSLNLELAQKHFSNQLIK